MMPASQLPKWTCDRSVPKKSFTVSSRDPFRYFRFFDPFLASPKNSAKAPGTVKTWHPKTETSSPSDEKPGSLMASDQPEGEAKSWWSLVAMAHTPPPPDKNEWKWLHFCTVKEFTTKLFLEEAGVFSCWIFVGGVDVQMSSLLVEKRGR